MKAKIHVTLKTGVLDPQGAAIQNSLINLGIKEVAEVKQGKYFEMEFSTEDKSTAERLTEQACKELLANQVIENYRYEVCD